MTNPFIFHVIDRHADLLLSIASQLDNLYVACIDKEKLLQILYSMFKIIITMFFKTAIKKIFNLLGFEIKKIAYQNKKEKFVISNPIEDNSLSRIEEFYSNQNFVEQYLDQQRLNFYSQIVQVSIEKGVIFEDKSVVDVGCATGHLLLEVAQKFNSTQLTGLEYSIEAVKRAAEFCPQAKFYQHNIYESYPHLFDIVFCLEVLEHLEYPDKALHNLTKMLNPSGVAIITVPNGRIDQFLGHINFWSPESWKIFVKSTVVDCHVEFDSLNDNKYNLVTIKKES